MRSADLLVQTLEAHDVDRVFCVPGESYIAVLDALYDRNRIQIVTCRHESGAGFMALADAKVTGRPGVALVSRGPGATNAAIAIHSAEQDAVPLVLLIGQVARFELGRNAFQEIDYALTFADMAKAVWTVHHSHEIAEITARALHVAQAGTPGPVIVVLPEDMLRDETAAPVAGPRPVARTRPAPKDVAEVADLIAKAERPLVIAGGMVGSAAGRAALLAAAEAHHLPVATSFKRQDIFPNAHPNFAGHFGFKIPEDQIALANRADLILAAGTRLNDVSTQGWRIPRAPTPLQPLIHLYPDPARIGAIFETRLGLAADPVPFLADLARLPAPPITPERRAWIGELRAYVDDLFGGTPAPADDGVNFGAVVMALKDRLPDDAILITDGGNFSSWVHRHFRFKPSHLLIGAVAGGMGNAMPAAVAAGLRAPGRQIAAFIGDGGFLMTGAELATAVHHKVPIRVFLSNNGSYGTIRLHQEKAHPGRVIATDLTNPDFAKLAEAFGAKGILVEREGDVVAAVEQALAHPGPVVVEVRSSLEQISAFTTITDLRAGA